MKTPELSRTIPLQVIQPTGGWLEEPRLKFGGDVEDHDPKTGISLAGPFSAGPAHPSEIHVRLIGTAQAMNDAAEWLVKSAQGVDGDDAHAPFPGTSQHVGFRFNVKATESAVGKITQAELRTVGGLKTSRQRFEAFLNLLDIKLRLVHDRGEPTDCIIIVLEDELYKKYRSVDYREGGRHFHRDLRRAFKALAMRYGITTQLLRHTTVMRPYGGRGLDHPATVAWNLFTGLYFKAGGAPWVPVGLPPGSCEIGVSFYRPLGDDSSLCTSVVQAFDEHGDIFVLRGHSFPWDERHRGRQPHLPAEQAGELIEMVLKRYGQERGGQQPQRVVVHKRSRFAPEERNGFLDALGSIESDLVALRKADDVRLVRAGQYPPLRGTWYSIEDHSYLYTTGYLHHLARYPHGHVPAPLEIADHLRGDTPRTDILREILLLTKMNWNSAGYAETLPITLRFASLVGDILRELPDGVAPQPRYAFYM